MIYPLKDIASIQSGIYAKSDPRPDIIYLQAKDFSDNGTIKDELHAELKLDNKIEKHLLKAGDILFAAKGFKNFAAVIDDTMDKAVASSTFFVIRINELYKEKVLPEYIVWFINHPQSQQYLKGSATGTSLPLIAKPVIEDLKISIPSRKIQEEIIYLNRLRKKEQNLKQQLEELRELELNYTLLKITQQ